MMEGELIFCADSILRFRSSYDETTALPLLAIQRTTSDADPFFLLRFFRHPVIIEEGTTLADILMAIEPWKGLLSAYLDRDVGAYIDEVRKPSRPGTFGFEWIGIDRRSAVHRTYVRQGAEESENFTDYFNRERIATDEFDIEMVCDASGFVKGEQERWSLSEDIHEIKNLPVMLYNRQTLAISGEDALLNKNVSGVRCVDRTAFVYGETSFCLFEVMEAIFISGLFFYSPKAAAENLEELKNSIAGQEEENTQAIDSTPVKDSETKTLNIEVAEGAFDSLIDHMEAEAEEWQAIKKACQKEKTLPVRIGVITPAVPPETRFYGEVIKLEGEQAQK